MISLCNFATSLGSNFEHCVNILDDARKYWNSEELTSTEKGKLVLKVVIVAGDAIYEVQQNKSAKSKGDITISFIASTTSLTGVVILKTIEGKNLLSDVEISEKGGKVLTSAGILLDNPILKISGQLIPLASLAPRAFTLITNSQEHIISGVASMGERIFERTRRLKEWYKGMKPLTFKIQKRKFAPIPKEHHENSIFKKYLCQGTDLPIRCPVCTYDHPDMIFEKAYIVDWLTTNNTHPLTDQPLALEDLRLRFDIFKEIEKERTKLGIPS